MLLLLVPISLAATVADLVAEMKLAAAASADSPAVVADWRALARDHGLADASWKEYLAVRLAFETTRDGGLWGLRWTVTNQPPTAAALWTQMGAWRGEEALADGECDELSALFASLARAMGVREVGLFWPRWNHTVAVWTAAGVDGNPVRIVVPTSQIYLAEGADLGTSSFDPRTQRTIYRFPTSDIPLDRVLAPAVYDRLVGSLRDVELPSSELQRRRDERSAAVGGS